MGAVKLKILVEMLGHHRCIQWNNALPFVSFLNNSEHSIYFFGLLLSIVPNFLWHNIKISFANGTKKLRALLGLAFLLVPYFSSITIKFYLLVFCPVTQ